MGIKVLTSCEGGRSKGLDDEMDWLAYELYGLMEDKTGGVEENVTK